jgi:hypothetical protein
MEGKICCRIYGLWGKKEGGPGIFFFLSLPPLTCLNGFVPKEGIPYFEGKFFMFAARRAPPLTGLNGCEGGWISWKGEEGGKICGIFLFFPV